MKIDTLKVLVDHDGTTITKPGVSEPMTIGYVCMQALNINDSAGIEEKIRRDIQAEEIYKCNGAYEISRRDIKKLRELIGGFSPRVARQMSDYFSEVENQPDEPKSKDKELKAVGE